MTVMLHRSTLLHRILLGGILRRNINLSSKPEKVRSFMDSIRKIYPQLPERHPEAVRLQQVLSSYEEWNKKSEYLAELQGLSKSADDEEMAKLIEEDLEECERELELLNTRLMQTVTPPDPEEAFDDIIMEIQPGVGGQESMLFAFELFQMYRRYIDFKQIWTISNYEESRSNVAGGLTSGSFSVSGPGCYKLLRFEGGIHRVQRVPVTERKGRPHTSTATVTVLPSPSDIQIDLKSSDIRVDVMRASGPGGQHVNTTESAVRVTHLPTGLQAESQRSRSQPDNRKTAMGRLRARLYELKFEADNAERRGAWKLQVGSRGRSEKIRTYNFMKQQVIDHRIKETFHGTDEILNGTERFDKLIQSLQRHHLHERVARILSHPPSLQDILK